MNMYVCTCIGVWLPAFVCNFGSQSIEVPTGIMASSKTIHREVKVKTQISQLSQSGWITLWEFDAR